MAGIKDVADAAGVSTATVSRALRGLPQVSEQTRSRIVRLADELGYVPSSSAAGLRSGRTMAISVVVPAVDGWFPASVIEGVDTELRAAGYDMVLFLLGGGPDERERLFHGSALRRRGDALLALSIDLTEDEREQLTQIELPSVVVGGRIHGLRHVGIDEADAAQQAIGHLIDHGHRDILLIDGGEEEHGRNSGVSRDRRRGYERALRAAGIQEDATRSIDGGFSMTATRRRVGAFLDAGADAPTAVFAASDEMAIGAMLALGDHGLAVPADVSVIGIDDHPLAASFGLTTVAQHPFAQGTAAARLLLDELAGRASRRRAVKMPVELIVRSSTAPPAHSSRPRRRGDRPALPGRPAAGPLPVASFSAGGSVPPFAVIVPTLERWFYSRVVEGIEKALLEAGREMTLWVARTRGDRELAFGGLIAQGPFEGLIAVGMQPGVDAVAGLRGLGPMLAVGSAEGLLPSVSIDQVAAGRFATGHLLSLGHTDIAHLAGTGAGAVSQSVRGMRRRGFEQAMTAAGLDPTARVREGRLSMPGGYELGRDLFGDPDTRPTAVFAGSDEMAFGALVAAREFGIAVPHELSVIGIDDHEAAGMFALTTLSQRPAEQGRRAADLLLSLSDTEDALLPATTVFPFRLVVRSSTTAPPRRDRRPGVPGRT
nr:substrate-binding domain-containing protein [Microbacterium bovistercoris]